jgi:hypothetical protein
MRRSFVAVALALVAGASIVQAQGTTAAPPAAQTPAAQPAPVADPLKFAGVDDVILVVQVKPGGSADFEAGFKEMQAALAASPKPELVAHGKTMSLSKVDVAPPDGSSLYVLAINKPSADLSYNVGLILFYSGKPQGAVYDGPIATQDAALVLYKKIQDNITNINPWPLKKIGG